MKKTGFLGFCNGEICEGCKLCVKGEKVVLFISGVCPRNCWYCSLSENRKNKDVILANEREINNEKELIEEARESNARGMGITGGDPFLFHKRVVKFSRAVKKRFGNKFHIHIYLPLKMFDIDKIKEMSNWIDEFRFHPDCFEQGLMHKRKDDTEKIKRVSRLVGKARVGIELPLIPQDKKKIIDFIIDIKDYISFVNLNEFELSETNFDKVIKKYKLKNKGYVISGSLETGIEILKELDRNKTNINVHVCTADTKNYYQFKNRLMKHKILPFGMKTKEGTVIYYIIKNIDKKIFDEIKIKAKGEAFLDNKKRRTIIPLKKVTDLIGHYKIYKVEEYPTYDGEEVEASFIG